MLRENIGQRKRTALSKKEDISLDASEYDKKVLMFIF